jgi:iron complex outermembrane receptor protein
MGRVQARLRAVLFAGAAVTGTLGCGGRSMAADAEPPTGPSAVNVEEVIVTARRVAERLQDVPSAITAVNAKQLEQLRPRTLEDLSGFAPNVNIGRTGAGPGTSAIYVRGLGYSDVEKGQNPAVELIVDDVVIGTNFGQLVDPYDVSSIEVDRGPSGIFYGRNSIGGVINIHRTKPTREWGLDLDLGYGNYNNNVEKIVLNAPIGQTAGLKVSMSHDQRDGFLDNIYTHDTSYGKNELTTGNLQFDWNITPKLEANFGLTLTHQDGQGTPVALGDVLSAQVLGPALAPFGIRFNQYGSPYIPGVTVPLGPWQVANDYGDRNLMTSQIYSLNVAYDSPIGQFTSITAFIKENDDTEQDFDGSCANSDLGGLPCNVIANPLLAFLHTSRPQKYDQFTEELRFNHDFGDRAKLLAGFYYFHDDISAVQLTRTLVPGVPVDVPFTNQISGDVTESKSVFGNLIFNVTKRLSISAGVRYIDENTYFHNDYNLLWLPAGTPGCPSGCGPVNFPLIADLPNGFTGDKSASKVVDKETIDYKLTDDNLIYFDRSVGFRSGGLSPRSTLSESIPGQTNYSPGANYSTFNPETDTSYEIGSKNTFFNRQLVVNLAAFITEDIDHQSTQVVVTPNYGPGTNTYIVNLPKVEIKGAEFELTYRPQEVPGLTLGGVGGYESARVTNGKIPGVEAPVNANGTAGAPGTTYDLTGTTLERVPDWNFTLRGDYTRPIGIGTADFNVQYAWSDRYVFAYFVGLPDYQQAFGLLNMSASYAWSRYRLVLSVKNLTNQVYYSNTLPSVFFHGWGDPRTVLGEIQVKF